MPNAISPFVNMARIGSKIAHYQKWPKTFLNLAKSGKSCHTVYMCVCVVCEREIGWCDSHHVRRKVWERKRESFVHVVFMCVITFHAPFMKLLWNGGCKKQSFYLGLTSMNNPFSSSLPLSLSLSYCPLFLFGMSLFLLGMSLFLLGMSDMSLSLSLLDTSFFHSFS